MRQSESKSVKGVSQKVKEKVRHSEIKVRYSKGNSDSQRQSQTVREKVRQSERKSDSQTEVVQPERKFTLREKNSQSLTKTVK